MGDIETETYSPKILAQRVMDAIAAHAYDGQFIYFITCNSQFVKIGHSASPLRRIAEMAPHTPFDLKLLKAIRGSAQAEKVIHAMLSEFSHRGEWFRLEPFLHSVIEQLPNDKLPGKWEAHPKLRPRGFPTQLDLQRRLEAAHG